MVNRIISRIALPIRDLIYRPVRSLHQAAYLLALFAFLSQLLALVRDRLLAASFGAGHTLDVYYAAFRIPDLLFVTIASLLSLYALMPVLTRLESESAEKMIAFLRETLFGFFAVMALIALIAAVLAPFLIRLVAPGFTAGTPEASQLVLLTRILLLQPILLGGSNILSNLTQMRDRFTLYAVSPILYNLGIILGILFFYPQLGIVGLGWGVVLGAAMHFGVQVPFFLSQPSSAFLPVREALAHVKEVLMLSVPRTLALASTQLSLFALTALASFLAAGSISIFMFAYNLQAVPVAIIGISYSVAAFPTLARLYANGALEQLAAHAERALRSILFWSIPITVLTIVLRAQLVRVILGAGAFDWSATRLTAAALALFVLSLVAQNATLLISRTYYAAGESRRPFYWGMVDVFVSVGAAVALAGLFHLFAPLRYFVEALLRVDNLAGTTVLMLALGLALGSIAEAVVGYRAFVRDFKVPTARLARLAWQSFGASVIGGAAAYAALALMGSLVPLSTTLAILLQGIFGGVVGLAVTGAVLAALKNAELAEVLDAFRRRLAPAEAVARPALEVTDVES